MSILAAVPGGSLLEAPIEVPLEKDWTPFAEAAIYKSDRTPARGMGCA